MYIYTEDVENNECGLEARGCMYMSHESARECLSCIGDNPAFLRATCTSAWSNIFSTRSKRRATSLSIAWRVYVSVKFAQPSYT